MQDKVLSLLAIVHPGFAPVCPGYVAIDQIALESPPTVSYHSQTLIFSSVIPLSQLDDRYYIRGKNLSRTLAERTR